MPMTNLKLIDAATQNAREVLHRHGVDPLCRQHLDRAMAHLREAWIAEDGQKAETVESTIKNCEFGEKLTAFVIQKDKESQDKLPISTRS